MNQTLAVYPEISSLSGDAEASCITLFPGTKSHHPLRVYQWDAVISGRGLAWLDGKLVTTPDLMPKYWRERLNSSGPHVHPSHAFTLPVRDIYKPCISAVGWGWQIYGHVLIEMIPRVILALMAAKRLDISPLILLRSDTPAWVENLLFNHLGFASNQIEVFDPFKEKVRLHRGLLPTYPLSSNGGFHPATAQLLDELHGLPSPSNRGRHVYITRRQLPPALHRWRSCENEAELGDIASREFGFEEVAPETLSWPEQVGLFRGSRAICGLHGSALHTAIFAESGLRMGIIGRRNNTQTRIAELRSHQVFYLESEPQKGLFRVDADAFRDMLSRTLGCTQLS